MTKARKDHVCDLCHGKIKSGKNYHRQRIPPWEHENNDVFHTFKAHPVCLKFWYTKYGYRVDYMLNHDPWEFRELLGEWLINKVVKPMLTKRFETT